MIDESVEDPDRRARRALLDVLSLAFRDNPMNVAIHGPRPERRLRANRAGLRALVLDSAGQTATRVIRDQGRIVGGFVAAPPGLFPIVTPQLHRQIACLLVQGGRAMDRWSIVSSQLMGYRPVEDHWYLAVLGVIPEFQGRGLGGRLIDELNRLIAADPHPLYLESDRAASVRFYLSRGFAVRAEETLDGIRCWCLGRGFAGGNEDLCDSVRE
jgi:ribosomal protein S18 acetylase RimI-like enzyme